jgi:hypothetical protein
VTPEEFIVEFLEHLRKQAAVLRSYGAEAQATTCERNAADLGERFRTWWLAELTVPEAAEESGYSETRLRDMAREGKLPHKKPGGENGHIIFARCNLPRRPKPQADDDDIASLADRLLKRRPADLRKPA